jgi:enamine deaminase RidA (YjgF/YER057c/UK114 family)
LKVFLDIVNPPALGRPRGYSHGVLAPPGARLLFVAGQTAADADGRVVNPDFVAQFDEALRKVAAVVRAAGGHPDQIARMTVYVADMSEYLSSRSVLKEVWRSRMGDHYPAMALVQVTRLVDRDATVEIEATAVLS